MADESKNVWIERVSACSEVLKALSRVADAVTSGEDRGADAAKLEKEMQEALAKTAKELDEAVEKLKETQLSHLEVHKTLAETTDKLKASEEKVREEHEASLRAAAELENYRRRAARDREETLRFGQERLVKSLLPVMDNLERALDPQNSADAAALRLGVEMTLRDFERRLEAIGVQGKSAMGEPFDPHLHEALQMVESDAPENTVIGAMGRSYTLNGRLIRPAQVIVSKGQAAVQPAPSGADAAVVPSDADSGADTDIGAVKSASEASAAAVGDETALSSEDVSDAAAI